MMHQLGFSIHLPMVVCSLLLNYEQGLLKICLDVGFRGSVFYLEIGNVRDRSRSALLTFNP